MQTLVNISKDSEKLATYEEERNSYYELIKERAEIFTAEAQEVGLSILPYKAGFFISVPSPDAKAVCDELHKENIFLVPLKKGVRIAVCAVPKAKIKGMAGKILAAMKAVGQA